MLLSRLRQPHIPIPPCHGLPVAVAEFEEVEFADHGDVGPGLGGEGVFGGGEEGFGLLDVAFLEVEGGRRGEAGIEEPGFELAAAEVAPVEFEFGGRGVLFGEDAGEGGDDGLAGEGEFDGDVVGFEDGDEAGFFAFVLGDVAEEGFALLAEEGEGGFLFADEPGLGLDGVALGDEVGQGEGAKDEGVGKGGVDEFPVVDEVLGNIDVVAGGDGAEVGDGAGEGGLAAEFEADGGLVFHQPEPDAGGIIGAGAEEEVAVAAEGGEEGELEIVLGFALGFVVVAEGLELGEGEGGGRVGVEGEDDGAVGEGVGLGPMARVGVEDWQAVIFFYASHKKVSVGLMGVSFAGN